MTIKDTKKVGVICLVAGFCVFSGAQGTAHAASFDCKKAKAPIEKAICAPLTNESPSSLLDVVGHAPGRLTRYRQPRGGCR